MHLRPRKPSGRLLLAVTAVVLAASLWAATASPQATASPPSSSIITLDQLQSMLNAAPDGTITGYFKTIVGGSTTALQTPVNIPVTITSIVPNQTSEREAVAVGHGADEFFAAIIHVQRAAAHALGYAADLVHDRPGRLEENK